MARAASAMKGRRKKPETVRFSHQLALARWALELLGWTSWRDAKELADANLEGLDSDGVHKFHYYLRNRNPLQASPPHMLTDEALTAYEANIRRHTRSINERRQQHGGEPVRWKYFQYLALLFTEAYLDRWFKDAAALESEIAAVAERMRSEAAEEEQSVLGLDPEDGAGAPGGEGSNKLAYWMATGAGKTLLMHINILQYRHYLEQYGRKVDRTILLTPNEGLSRQHLLEFAASGMPSELFDGGSRGLYTGRAIEILDINKLREKEGQRTFAVEAFEGNNLVLVDEGHRGASSGGDGKWMERRNQLCEGGFSFEYSATFAQAVKGDPELTAQYARCILMDYSYRHFHGDGFGKHYRIMNLDEAAQKRNAERYLVAALLVFHQQLHVHETDRRGDRRLGEYNLEKPLWVFVGGSVTKGFSKDEGSDILRILRFIARFAKSGREMEEHIRVLLDSGFPDDKGKDLLKGRLDALRHNYQGEPGRLREHILERLFNSPTGGALHLTRLKDADGEIALQLGDQPDQQPFGVINVGEPDKLCSMCEGEPDIHLREAAFSGSLFAGINRPDSPVNLLIGSRKFTEGWNSFRVASMGLMNIGKGEGAQIIQLFGRGVRLRGKDGSLKRTSNPSGGPAGVPRHLRELETLNVFGIEADYMRQFLEFLKEEELPVEPFEYHLPVVKNLGRRPLKVIRLKEEINGVKTKTVDAFKKLGPVPTLKPPSAKEFDRETRDRLHVDLNWYPRIRAIQSSRPEDEESALEKHPLSRAHLAFVDTQRLYFDLLEFKYDRGWNNFNLRPDAVEAVIADEGWYTLHIPSDYLAMTDYDKVRQWQEIATALMRKYCERFYNYHRQAWESRHLEYQVIGPDDPNFPEACNDIESHKEKASRPDGCIRVVMEEQHQPLLEDLQAIEKVIRSRQWRDAKFPGVNRALFFDRHLYVPLLYGTGGNIQVRPVALNDGERQFVEHLKDWCDRSLPKDRDLFLLRNLSRGKGVGFFEAAGFHPDLILWLLEEGRQTIAFIDPKGLRNLGPEEPKVRFARTIKEIEKRLGKSDVRLESFLLSRTPMRELGRLWGASFNRREDYERHHIHFIGDDGYVARMMGELTRN